MDLSCASRLRTVSASRSQRACVSKEKGFVAFVQIACDEGKGCMGISVFLTAIVLPWTAQEKASDACRKSCVLHQDAGKAR